MNKVLLLAVLLGDGLALGLLQNSLIKKKIQNTADNLLYLGIVFGFGSVVMFFAGGRFGCSAYTCLLGILTGFLIILEAFSYVNALKNGPISLTSMLCMASMIIPMIPSGILWNEPMTPLQIGAGLLMLLAIAMILQLFGKKENGSVFKGINKKWLLFSFLSFLAGGCMGFPQKYQTIGCPEEIMSYLLWAFVTAAVLTVPFILLRVKGSYEKITLKLGGKLLTVIACCGIMTALLHILTMKCFEVIPVSVVLPVSNGGRLILFTLADMFLFKQKLTKQQLAGIVCGCIAILLLSV